MNDNEPVFHFGDSPEFWQTEAQTLLVLMRDGITPECDELRAEFIAVFRAAMHGWPIPPCPRWQEMRRQFETTRERR
jgi:hypothetical protein